MLPEKQMLGEVGNWLASDKIKGLRGSIRNEATLHRGETARPKRLRDRVDCEFERRTLVTNDPPPPPDRINAVKARVPRLYYPIPWLRGNPPRILVFLGWIMDWGKKSAMIPIFRRIESVNRE